MFQGSFSTKSKSKGYASPMSKKAYGSKVSKIADGMKSPSEMDIRSGNGSRISDTMTKTYTKPRPPKAKEAAPRNRKRWG